MTTHRHKYNKQNFCLCGRKKIIKCDICKLRTAANGVMRFVE